MGEAIRSVIAPVAIAVAGLMGDAGLAGNCNKCERVIPVQADARNCGRVIHRGAMRIDRDDKFMDLNNDGWTDAEFFGTGTNVRLGNQVRGLARFGVGDRSVRGFARCKRENYRPSVDARKLPPGTATCVKILNTADGGHDLYGRMKMLGWYEGFPEQYSSFVKVSVVFWQDVCNR